MSAGFLVALCNKQHFVPGMEVPFDKDEQDLTPHADKLRYAMTNIFNDRVGALFFMPHKPNKLLQPEKTIVNPHRPYVANNDSDNIFDSKGTTLLAYVVHSDTDNVLVRNKQTPNTEEEALPGWLCTPDGKAIEVGAQI